MTVVPAKAGTHDHRLWNMGPRLRGDDYMVGANAAMLMMVVKRMLIAVPSLIGVVIVTFLLTRALPGDPAAYFAGPAATKEAIEQIRVKLGLDRPLYVQFIRYVGDLARGDLGNSLTTGQPVGYEIKTRLPASAELTLLGLMVSMAIAVPLGILAATRPNSIIDHVCRVVSTAGVSLPVFFTGLILIYVFYYLLGWAPAPLGRLDVFFSPPPHVTGFYLVDSLIAGDGEVFFASLKQLVLPALTLGIFSLAPIARMTRASMLAVLASDFVRTARASGLTPFTVIVTYAFRNAMLPVITTLGMVFSFLLGANVLVEKVFAWPGIGSFAVEALIASDFAPLQGFVLTMAVMYVVLNLLIDVLYGLIDPRVRIEA
jgi:dipeptide transport system permease protein